MKKPLPQIKNLKESEVLYLMKGNTHVGNLYKDYFEHRTSLAEDAFPAFNVEKKIHISKNVLIPFLSRLPNKNRVNYPRLLESYGLNYKDTLTDFMLLGYSGAYLPCDPFWLMNPFKNAEPPFEFVLKLNHVSISSFELYKDLFEGWLEKGYQIRFKPFKEDKSLELAETNSGGYTIKNVKWIFVEVKPYEAI